jgi:hypothetical protein
MKDERANHLWNHKTINGRTIVLDSQQEQNWLRTTLSTIQAQLIFDARRACEGGENWPSLLELVLTVVDGLESNLRNPEHYGENQPGLFTAEGKPVLVDPVFTYFDLWGFGTTGEGGRLGFLRRCNIPEGASHSILLFAVGLLLVDSAIEAADIGRDSFSAYLMGQATRAGQVLLLSSLHESPASEVKKAIREQMARAGQISGAVRRLTARATPVTVREMANRLTGEGKDPRDIAAIIARRLSVTPDYVRRQLKKQT